MHNDSAGQSSGHIRCLDRKTPLLSLQVTRFIGLPMDRKVEMDAGEVVSEDWLRDQLHPKVSACYAYSVLCALFCLKGLRRKGRGWRSCHFPHFCCVFFS